MSRALLPLLLLLAGGSTVLGCAAGRRASTDPEPIGDDRGKRVIIAGDVASVQDADEDGRADTFVIQTGEGTTKTVVNLMETDGMAIIRKGDHVALDVEIQPSGELRIANEELRIEG